MAKATRTDVAPAMGLDFVPHTCLSAARTPEQTCREISACKIDGCASKPSPHATTGDAWGGYRNCVKGLVESKAPQWMLNCLIYIDKALFNLSAPPISRTGLNLGWLCLWRPWRRPGGVTHTMDASSTCHRGTSWCLHRDSRTVVPWESFTPLGGIQVIKHGVLTFIHAWSGMRPCWARSWVPLGPRVGRAMPMAH